MESDVHQPATTVPPADAIETPELPLFRFGLRQLLVFVTLLSLLMAAMAVSQGRIALVLLLAALVVTLHVFSTALGSQLRAHANRTQSRETASGLGNLPRTIRTPVSIDASADRPHRSPWQQRHGTPLPWLVRLIASSALIGGIFGGLFLQFAVGHRATPAGVAVGAASVAVVAGWFAFLSYSFYGVFRHGLRDALAHERHHRPR
jgi:hypothetical protein